MTDQLLVQLDKLGRSRRRQRRASLNDKPGEPVGFREEEEYSFESGHFDEVISGYREMQLTQLKSFEDKQKARLFADTLQRLERLLPSSTLPPLIHVLHLSAEGKIDAHIDNIEASGPTIVGLSLGSARVMRLGHQSCPIHSHLKVLLPPGSVYIQRDSVRYNLQHSIQSHDSFKGKGIRGAQRLSLMLRDRKLTS